MTNFISEIGINHNGSIELCKELIKLSHEAGATHVKIQKRTPDLCVPEHQKNKMKSTPWGDMTYLEYKNKIEFNEEQIIELLKYCKELGTIFFASVWDIPSVDVMAKYTKIGKIPSALITDIKLCEYARENFETLIISTGMSTEEEITECICSCNPDVIMHTNSTYPCKEEELNLRYIEWLLNKYPQKQIGYSGHELKLCTTLCTIPMGVTWIERHFTKDKTLWGSDQNSSIEPNELKTLIDDIKTIEKAMQYKPGPRILFQSEHEKRYTLRK